MSIIEGKPFTMTKHINSVNYANAEKIGKKYCRECNTVKEKKEFYQSKNCKDGLEPICKECSSKRKKRALENNPNIYKRQHLRSTYGLSDEKYESMLKMQSGLCMICHEPERYCREGKVLSLAVDHKPNTKPKFVRSLLCHKCNMTYLGNIEKLYKSGFLWHILDFIEFCDFNYNPWILKIIYSAYKNGYLWKYLDYIDFHDKRYEDFLNGAS